MNKISLLTISLIIIAFSDFSFAQGKAALESNEIYKEFLPLSEKEKNLRFDIAYHTNGNKVLDVDKSYSDAQKKFLKKSHDVMTKTLTDHKKEIADCVKKRLHAGAANEGFFSANSSLFTFKDIDSKKQRKSKLTSDELLIGLSNPAGYRMQILQIPDGGTAVNDLRETPGKFIIGLGVQHHYLNSQKTGDKKKLWDYALSGKNGNVDTTLSRDLKAVTDEAFLAGVMAHEMAHNYGLDHSPMGGSEFTYVGALGFCVTLVARRNSVAQKLGFQSGPSSPANASGQSTNQ